MNSNRDWVGSLTGVLEEATGRALAEPCGTFADVVLDKQRIHIFGVSNADLNRVVQRGSVAKC